ncbi:2-amino-4-hydroxy-6-hydroxymethyldihydropteridine diphosphokinase [Microbacterium sp. AZCO]|uniref:2-amino-4-hydroxy-6- hydroxymethyldihydropteridine diphosphokinase n=1 Tax=Microbacterium sp. AZCO TaxID=3142976 RepID=UPI0031F3EE57
MNRRLAQGFHGDAPSRGRAPVRAVVALGANLGDRVATLRAAVADLQRLPLTAEVVAAPTIESVALKPDGPDASAPAYLNTVALVTTRLAPSVLLSYLHAIEARHGRVREERWGDRTLDLDLIAYGDARSDAPGLVLPHPRAAERDFVLAPWLSLDPDAELPGHGRVDALLRRLRGAE